MYSGGSRHPKVKKAMKENNLTMKDVKRHIAEFYRNGQVKMIIEYVGEWDTRRCMELGWIDYDEEGNIMQFDDPVEDYDDKMIDRGKKPRKEWVIGMYNKYRSQMDEDVIDALDGVIFPEHPNQDPDTNKKDFDTMWECALYVKSLITKGALDLKFNEGYQWATRHCSIQGADIDDWKKLKKNYENALARNESKVLEFEGLD